MKSNHKKEFSRFAKGYKTLSNIQNEVTKTLIQKVKHKNDIILDIGCGYGSIYNHINWKIKYLFAIDISKDMCDLHTKALNIEVMQLDFDDKETYKLLKDKNINLILSSSALQWSNNLDNIFKNISTISPNIAISIFTNNSLQDLLNTLNIKSSLPSLEQIKSKISKYFKVSYDVKTYNKSFKSTLEMLRFIKQSGISGGIKKSNVKDIRKIINEDKIRDIEFEVCYLY